MSEWSVSLFGTSDGSLKHLLDMRLSYKIIKTIWPSRKDCLFLCSRIYLFDFHIIYQFFGKLKLRYYFLGELQEKDFFDKKEK
jgi:hypothetical protein